MTKRDCAGLAGLVGMGVLNIFAPEAAHTVVLIFSLPVLFFIAWKLLRHASR
jgi:hypothetical protein